MKIDKGSPSLVQTYFHRLAAAILLLLGCMVFMPDAAAQNTSFTYQGYLRQAGAPANGTYDLQFGLFNTNSGGTPVGGVLLTNSNTTVSEGKFTVPLDFGNVFDGTAYWLEIAVRSNAVNPFVTLTPRQPITPAPYALRADAATSYSGLINDNQLSSNLARLNSGVQNFSGIVTAKKFVGDGQSLSNVLRTANNLGDVSNPLQARANIGALGATNGVAYGLTGFGSLQLKTNSAVDWAELWLDNGQNIHFGPLSELTCIYYNNQHAPYGELQIACGGSISLNEGMNARGGSVIQIGKTGPSHGRVQFQYDADVSPTNALGYSKIVNWVSSFWDTNIAAYNTAYVGMQSFGTSQNGDAELRFYNPSPSWMTGVPQNQTTPLVGGSIKAIMGTNGWLMNGVMDRELVNAPQFTSGATNTVYVDFNTSDFKTVTLNANNISFVSSNLAKINGARSVSMRVLNGSSTNFLHFPHWTFENSLVPASLPPLKVALLRLTAFGTNDHDIFAEWKTSDQDAQ